MASLRKPPFVKVHFNSVVWITFYKPKELFSTENNLLCNKKAPRMLKVLHGIIHTLKKVIFYSALEKLNEWILTEQHYGAAGGRFLCPQAVCRRSLWLTSPSPQCNYRLLVWGREDAPDRRSASRETGHIPTHFYIYSSVLLDQHKNWVCMFMFHIQRKRRLSLTYRSDSPYKSSV